MTDSERIEELEACMSANDELMQKLYSRIAELEEFAAFAASTFSNNHGFVKMANELLAKGDVA